MTLLIDHLAQTGRWRHRSVVEKCVLAGGLLALAVGLPPWPGAVLVLAVSWTAALAGARVRMGDWLRLAAAPMGFVATGAVALAIDLGPDGLHLAADHGRAAVQVSLRAAAGVSCLLLLAVTTPTPDLISALRRSGLSAEIAEVALLTWRFLFLLLETASSIRAAQDSRLGWEGWRRKIRSLGLLVAALLPNALDRARMLEVGLAARGFDGSLRMLSPVTPVSWPMVAAMVGGLAVLAGVSLCLS